MPLDVIRGILRYVDPGYLGVLKFVNRSFRSCCVIQITMAAAENKGTDDADNATTTAAAAGDAAGDAIIKPKLSTTTIINVRDMCVSPELLSWAFCHGCPFRDEGVCETAVSLGGAQTLRVARLHGCEWGCSVFEAACMSGDFQACVWTLENGCPCDTGSALNCAAMGGCVKTLEWLLESSIVMADKASPIPVAAAAEGGSLEAAKWLRERGFQWSALTAEMAAREGHTDILQWCIRSGCPWSSDVCSAAARENRLDMLRFLVDEGCPLDSTVCAAAASCGSIDILRFAHGRGVSWSARTCEAAASEGQLEALQWCRQHGCEWDSDVTMAAAEGGHLAVLQWLAENNCPMDEEIAMVAFEAGHHDVVSWLDSHGYGGFIEVDGDEHVAHIVQQDGADWGFGGLSDDGYELNVSGDGNDNAGATDELANENAAADDDNNAQ